MAEASTAASSQAIDSLPYYDRDLDTHPSLRQNLTRLLTLELKRNPPPLSTLHPRLVSAFPSPPPQASSSHPLLAASLARASQTNPPPLDRSKEGLDASRFALPAPASGEQASLEEWQMAVDNAGAQLEHQRLRLANLELAGKYGANSWRVGNFLVEKEVERVRKRVEARKEEVVEVNRRRKGMQTEAGETLNALENKWTELVSANIQLKIANVTMEAEVQQLRELEATLKRKLQETA